MVVMAAMLHTCDGVLHSYCDTGKMHAMCCDAFSNMLEFLLPILEFLSHIIRFSNGLQNCDGYFISTRIIYVSKLSVKYF